MVMKMRFFIFGFFCFCAVAFAGFAEGTEFPFTGSVNTDRVNIRAGQNRNFEAIGFLEKGAAVVVVDQSYSWYKIRLPEDAQSYVSRKLVQVLREGIGEITGTRVNIRARAALESAVIGQLNKGTLVRIVETLDEWLRIEPVDGLHGWVMVDFVDFQSGRIPPVKVVQLSDKSIYRQKEEEERLRAEKERLSKEPQKVELKGTVAVITGDLPGEDIRHQVMVDDGKIFYLSGYGLVPDGFINHRVHIEGLPQGGAASGQPVLLVTKVLLVL